MKARWLYMFWGTMDFLYVCRICWLNFSQGKIPFYNDIHSFISLSAEHGVLSVLLFSFSLALNVSIIFSGFLLFFEGRCVTYLVCMQTPFRLMFFTPSIFFIPWLAKVGDLTSVVLLIILLLVSEVLKIGSIVCGNKLRSLQFR
jgi:hypothetical protein